MVEVEPVVVMVALADCCALPPPKEVVEASALVRVIVPGTKAVVALNTWPAVPLFRPAMSR